MTKPQPRHNVQEMARPPIATYVPTPSQLGHGTRRVSLQTGHAGNDDSDGDNFDAVAGSKVGHMPRAKFPTAGPPKK